MNTDDPVTDEVSAFLEKVSSNLNQHRLWPEETFKQLAGGVLSGTEVDVHGDAMRVEALENMQIGPDDPVRWMGFQHDPLYHTVGRILATKVVGVGREHYLIGVFGIYDQDSYPSFADLGLHPVSPDELPVVDGQESPSVVLYANPRAISKDELGLLMSGAPGFARRLPSIEKAAETLAVITIVLSLTLIPFATGFLGQAGKDTYQWIKEMAARFRARRGARLCIVFSESGCEVKFIIPVENGNAETALEKWRGGVSVARGLAARALQKGHRLEHLVYEWDVVDEQWVPSYANGPTIGVVSDRRRLAALHAASGLSWVGTAVEEDSQPE